LFQTRRALKIFLVALLVFAVLGLLYTAHRGFDFLEIAIVAPVSAAFTTFYWLRKFPTPR
jgi:O-antigen/teichoic acid export membrane protein